MSTQVAAPGRDVWGLVKPRNAQWAEHFAAHDQYVAASDPDLRAYWRGVALGYLAAFLPTPYWAELHDDAKGVRWAAPIGYDLVLQHVDHYRPVASGMSLAEACGVLHGFKEATAERTDADQCSACDRRVLFVAQNDTLATCRTHGTFCDEACADSLCDRGCVLRDDRGNQPPPWFYDYQERHGSDLQYPESAA